MKKSLTRKLFLSVAALAATAATLTSSTFAWYTANTEAKVQQISASTESKGSDSLFIAAAQTYDDQSKGYAAKTWGGYLAEVTPVLTNNSAEATAKKLRPVYSNYATNAFNQAASTADENPATAVNGRSYNKITGASGSTATYDDESTTDFVEFVIRVRSGAKVTATEGQPLYFSAFNLTSTQSESTQIALASGEGTGITAAGEYSADLIKALKLDVTSKAVTLSKDSNTNKVSIPEAGVTSRLAGETAETDTVATYGFEALTSVTDVNIGTANAVGYYNKIMGTSIATPTSDYLPGTEVTKGEASATKALAVATLPKTADGYDFSVVEIRFVVYLDGWDNYCYDIMQNQSINFSFNLTTDDALSVIHTS